jgi:hypothetical protein
MKHSFTKRRGFVKPIRIGGGLVQIKREGVDEPCMIEILSGFDADQIGQLGRIEQACSSARLDTRRNRLEKRPPSGPCPQAWIMMSPPVPRPPPARVPRPPLPGTKYSATGGTIARGRPTEIDSLNGYVARRGAALGIATPASELVVAMVKLLEESALR